MDNMDDKIIQLKHSKWLWIPVERTLPNTFVLFRRELELDEIPVKVTGWITADSRYCLTVNGQRVQWGPPPFDPRWMEVDPFSIESYLTKGKNVIGVEVLWFGRGEGTYIVSNPGFIMEMELHNADGNNIILGTDKKWQFKIDRAHMPGQHEQWFLRALQESFDARKHPYGWNLPAFNTDKTWQEAFEVFSDGSKPILCAPASAGGVTCLEPDITYLRKRMIPPMLESNITEACLADKGKVIWHLNPEEWFDFRLKGAYEIQRDNREIEPNGGHNVNCVQGKDMDVEESAYWVPGCEALIGHYLTFEFPEQLVGWPYFCIEAEEGTIIELMEQESHDISKNPWMDTHFYTWQRFVCKEGKNYFHPFDYYSFRWIQLHIRNHTRPVRVYGVGAIRRLYNVPKTPVLKCSDSLLSKVFSANINTLRNSILDVVSDGFGRERQQYSGDCGHQLQVWRYMTGDTMMADRFITTYSQGITLDGYFMDCWPGSDRLTRIAQRQLSLTKWGPILDHGVQFVFDCWYHYMETGKLGAVQPILHRLIRFAGYLEKIRDSEGLLPVDKELGIPSVWMDHHAWHQQRHKKCSFNLYVSAMFTHALAPLCREVGSVEQAIYYERVGEEILKSVAKHYWCNKRAMFIDNLPWEQEEGHSITSDRTLATALIFDMYPDNQYKEMVNALAGKASYEDFKKFKIEYHETRVGLSYPANALWRHMALSKFGYMETVLDELRNVWGSMESVHQNNTLAEDWNHSAGTKSEWSHCPVAPLYAALKGIAGIRPLEAGFGKIIIEPQLGDLEEIQMDIHTPHGAIDFYGKKTEQGYLIKWTLPTGIQSVELVVPENKYLVEPNDMTIATKDNVTGKVHYLCGSVQEVKLVKNIPGELCKVRGDIIMKNNYHYVQEKLDMALNKDIISRVDRYIGWKKTAAGLEVYLEETNAVNISIRKWEDDLTGSAVEPYSGDSVEKRKQVCVLFQPVGQDIFHIIINPETESKEKVRPIQMNNITDDFKISEDDSCIRLCTGSRELVFLKEKAFYYIAKRNGPIIFEENNNEMSPYFGFISPPLGKVKQEGCEYRCQTFMRHQDEDFYGFGEQFTDFNKRNQIMEIWNVDPANTLSYKSYLNVPFYISTRGYGFVLNSFSKAWFDMGFKSANAINVKVHGDELDYYILAGENPKDILNKYYQLTGLPAMPPKWSFGLWMSSLGVYTSAENLISAAQRIREHDFATDVLHIDPPWLAGRKSLVCTLTWDEKFSDYKRMLMELKSRGYKLCLWICPYIPTTSELFEEGISKDYFVKDNSGKVLINAGPMNWFSARFAYVDFTNPEAKRWYKDLLISILKEGVDVYKPDLGELGAEEAQYFNGVSGIDGHNYYTLEYQRAVYEATKAVKGNEAMIWCRSGHIGSHKYPVHWAGDVKADYENMAGQLRAILSAGISGLPFFSHDIGGFIRTQGADPELFIRWFQFGMFTSHARIHGGAPREPWDMGDEADQICKKFVNLRYSLLPHIYSSAAASCERGEPLLKALVMEYPEDPTVRNLDTQFLFCDNILAAPMFKKEGSRKVYLPEGKWVDYWSGEVQMGGKWVEYDCPLDKMPLFVKAGSILMKMEPEQYITENKPWDNLTLEIYADTICKGVTRLYDNSQKYVEIEYELNKDDADIKLPQSLINTKVKLIGCFSKKIHLHSKG